MTTRFFISRAVFMLFSALMLSALMLSALLLFPLRTFSQTASLQTAPPKTASSLSISGTVREAASGEVVIGANVVIVRDTSRMTSGNILRGTRTNKFGYFSLPDIPEGAYFLVVRSVSFKTVITPCSVPMSSPLTVQLPHQTARTKEVTVRATRDLRETVQSVSRVEVRGETIGRLPAIAGQKDVFRALQLMPGIQTAGELSSGLYVRGGSPDQNLTLLDGAIIYNPSHLAGFFSTFTADAVQDVRLYKGAFPAEYGGRLSSVIDITMKEGNEKRIKGNATLSTILLEANADGPIPYTSSNATFMLSGRRMILDWFMLAQQELTDQVPSGTALPLYYFYDLNAKLNYKLSDNDRLFLSLYNGRDVLDFDLASAGLKLGLGYGNLSGNLRWAHIVSPSLFTNFSLIYTKYDYSTTLEARLGRLRSIFSTFSQIEDWTLRGEAEWLPAPNHAVKAGIEAIRHQFSTYVGSRIESIPANGGGMGTSTGGNSTPTTGNLLGAEAAFYAQDEWNIDNRLLLNLGARLSWFQAGGQINLEPRISAGYSLTNDVKLTTSFSIVNQYMHLLSRNDITLPSDTWLPATRTILPSRSMQGTLGTEFSLFGGEITATLEGYYKTMENLYEYRDGTLLNTLNTERLEEQLTRGSGVSYGAEILLERKMGQLTGWLGYTLSWATRTFPELNGGRPFAPRYDRRHNIALALTYTLDEQWEFGATWTYITGQPITLPAGKAAFEDIGAAGVFKSNAPNNANASANTPTTTYYTTERNGSRMTPFHKLDLSVTMRTIVFGFFPGEYFVSIYNAYNNMNPFAWFISTDGKNPFDATSGANTGVSNKPAILQFTLFPIFPTVGTRITL